MNTTYKELNSRFQTILLTWLLVLPLAGISFMASARGNVLWRYSHESPRVLGAPQGNERRHIRGDRPRKARHSIRSSFSRAGKSAGRGGKRFGQNIGHGRPIRGGKELGKGMGGFGKHTGRGVGRTMRRVFKP